MLQEVVAAAEGGEATLTSLVPDINLDDASDDVAAALTSIATDVSDEILEEITGEIVDNLVEQATAGELPALEVSTAVAETPETPAVELEVLPAAES